MRSGLVAALLTGTLVPALATARDRDALVWLGGDVHLGEGRTDPFELLRPVLGRAPLVVNLEGPVVKAAPPAAPNGPIRLWNGPEAPRILYRSGVRVAGLANNHAADAGPSGPRSTAAALRAAGIRPAGLASGSAVLALGGSKVVITAHDLSAGVPSGLRGDLRAARRAAPALIATFHVTGPPLYLPRPELKEAAAIALEEGASVVAAHGTHALGPVERRGQSVIAWGLGNLAFECDCTDETDGLILGVSLVGSRVASAEVVPLQAGLRGAPARPALDPEETLRLLEALGSSPLRLEGGRIVF